MKDTERLERQMEDSINLHFNCVIYNDDPCLPSLCSGHSLVHCFILEGEDTLQEAYDKAESVYLGVIGRSDGEVLYWRATPHVYTVDGLWCIRMRFAVSYSSEDTDTPKTAETTTAFIKPE